MSKINLVRVDLNVSINIISDADKVEIIRKAKKLIENNLKKELFKMGEYEIGEGWIEGIYEDKESFQKGVLKYTISEPDKY